MAPTSIERSQHSSPPRIGLLGGTFNPIHLGHLHIAEQTRIQCGFDHIVFIPTGDPPHKSFESLAPARHRLEMVKLAVQDHPCFQVSDIEVFSSQICYTIDTLHSLMNQLNGELFFLMGLDAFLDLPTWKSGDELLTTTNVVVVSRPAVQFSQLTSLVLLPSIAEAELAALDNGIRTHLEIATSPASTLTLMALPPCDISASAIRDGFQKGRSVADWLPVSVEFYRMKHQLYEVKKGA